MGWWNKVTTQQSISPYTQPMLSQGWLRQIFFSVTVYKSLLRDTQNSIWDVALETEKAGFTNVERLDANVPSK